MRLHDAHVGRFKNVKKYQKHKKVQAEDWLKRKHFRENTLPDIGTNFQYSALKRFIKNFRVKVDFFEVGYRKSDGKDWYWTGKQCVRGNLALKNKRSECVCYDCLKFRNLKVRDGRERKKKVKMSEEARNRVAHEVKMASQRRRRAAAKAARMPVGIKINLDEVKKVAVKPKKDVVKAKPQMTDLMKLVMGVR